MDNSTLWMKYGGSWLYGTELVELTNGAYLNIFHGNRDRVAKGLQYCIMALGKSRCQLRNNNIADSSVDFIKNFTR